MIQAKLMILVKTHNQLIKKNLNKLFLAEEIYSGLKSEKDLRNTKYRLLIKYLLPHLSNH